MHLSRIKATLLPESSQDTVDLGWPEEAKWMSEPLQNLKLLFKNDKQTSWSQSWVSIVTIFLFSSQYLSPPLKFKPVCAENLDTYCPPWSPSCSQNLVWVSGRKECVATAPRSWWGNYGSERNNLSEFTQLGDILAETWLLSKSVLFKCNQNVNLYDN